MRLAPQTIEALAQIRSGGGGNDSAPPIGIYRSGPKLESFMRAYGVHIAIGGGSRVPTLTTSLIGLVEREEADVLRTVIEGPADLRELRA